MAQEELPHLTDGYLGKQNHFDSYGLTTVSHPDPVIPLNTNTVHIVIGMPEKTRFTTKFKRMDPIKEMNNCVFTQSMAGNEMHYYVAVTQPGFYKFEIYCLPSGEAGPHFVNVFNYLINVKNVDKYVESFPKQYPVWKQAGCYVYEPMMLQKGVNYLVNFKFNIPQAIDVQIKAGDDWFKLERVEGNVFEGCVDFSAGYPPDTKVRLNVKFGRNNKYDILMEYSI